MFALLRTFSLQELLHHPWRTASALLAVVLGANALPATWRKRLGGGQP